MLIADSLIIAILGHFVNCLCVSGNTKAFPSRDCGRGSRPVSKRRGEIRVTHATRIDDRTVKGPFR
jgi:hypothetical protein